MSKLSILPLPSWVVMVMSLTRVVTVTFSVTFMPLAATVIRPLLTFSTAVLDALQVVLLLIWMT